MRKFLMATAGVMLLAMPAMAEPSPYAGYGTATCAELLKAEKIAPTLISDNATQWALGLITGVNLEMRSQLKKYVDVSGPQKPWPELKEYCQTHPDDAFSTAALTVFLKRPQVGVQPAAARE